MKKNRNFILVGFVAVLVGMMLFPPYQLQIKDAVTNMGYAPIFNPPKQWVHGVSYSASINVPVLLAQWVMALLVSGVAWFFTKNDVFIETTSSKSIDFNETQISASTISSYSEQETIQKNVNFPKQFTTLVHMDRHFIPVEEFAEYNGLTSLKIIEMIKIGSCMGRLIDGQWFVDYAEINTDKKNQAQPADPINANQPALTGVGGWLLLLVIVMMISSPGFSVIRVLGALGGSELSYPALVTLSAWKTYKTITCISLFGFVALSFWGGLGLLRGRDWSVVNRAKIILWINGPIAALVMLLIIPNIILSEPIDTQAITGFLSSVVSAYVWTAYLTKSKRVQNTYCGSVINSQDGSN
jgi:hypothetical protein